MAAAQSLGTLNQKPSDFLSFLYQNKALLIILVSGHFLAKLVLILFMRVAHVNTTRRPHRRFDFGWLHQTYWQIESHLSKLAVFFVFLSLFDFLILTMLTNSIKTDKLLIDTTHLIDSSEKVKDTKARPVFYQMESDYKLVSEAPRDSLLYRLFHRRFERKNGFYLVREESTNEDLFRLLQSDPSTYYLFMDRFPLIYTLFLSSSFFENIFFKPVNYYETLSVTYLRKNLEEGRKSDLIKK